MKVFMRLILGCSFFSYGFSQNNHVFSGGEMSNYGIVDLSLDSKIHWSSERSNQPGYFGVLGNASFIGYSDNVNINGYIKKYGNTTFTFPVGNGNILRTLEISNPDNETDTYAVAWIDGDPSDSIDPTEPYAGKHPTELFSGEIIQVSKIGQWDWQVGEAENLGPRTTGNGNGLTITVSIPDMRHFAEAPELRLVGWDGSYWIDLSGKSTATGNIDNSKLSGTMVPGITAIAIGRISPDDYISDRFLLYPNPVTFYNNINVRFNTSYSGIAELIVYDAIGRKVIQKFIHHKYGINVLPVNVENLSSGAYIINLTGVNGDKIAIGKRFIKL